MEIKIIFSGDFAPLLDQKKISDFHFKEMGRWLNDCDLHVTNLECPLTDSLKKINKSGPAIRATPKNIKLLNQYNAILFNMHVPE